MRVLHVHSGNLYGGVETYLVALARCGQVCPEMQTEFALCFEGRVAEELRGHAAVVHHLGDVKARFPWTVIAARRTLRRVLQEGRYDVAVCHSAWAQAIFGTAVRRAGTANVFYLHNAAAGRHWVERLAKRTRPQYAISNSRYTQASLAKLYPGLGSEVVCYPILRCEKPALAERAAVRAELRTSQNSIVIIQVSRMEAWKGQAQHLEALAELRENPAWVAWIVGGAQRPSERKYSEFLEEKARRLRIIDRIRFVGHRNDVARLLGAADIFCQPNLRGEPFGISFVEALYAGLPVVTVDVGGGREIVDDTCGILVPPGDTVALRNALSALIASPTLRAALGKAGPSRAAEVSDPRVQLPNLYDLLCRVLSGCAASTGSTAPQAVPKCRAVAP
jgi:glycosyltransferase involved in cell wall biosynthesis